MQPVKTKVMKILQTIFEFFIIEIFSFLQTYDKSSQKQQIDMCPVLIL